MLTTRQQHRLGVVCGLASSAWLGAAAAPMKLVATGTSPFIVTLGMVIGVFVARWMPALLKGTNYIVTDFKERPHLVAWALMAGMLWAVANTLTVFAIRDVGLAIAFPIWNLNSVVGLFWGWLLFGELRGARGSALRVVSGVIIMLIGAYLLAWVPAQDVAPSALGKTAAGLAAALGAALLLGTMYVPYRKAYISGMNPLSFAAVFTIGQLATASLLAVIYEGGPTAVAAALSAARPTMFWLFLGGFCWVLGDLFQQYAAKYLGLARGIPLSNTNQLWGLAWGILVFGELQANDAQLRAMVIGGSALMALGALVIGLASIPADEAQAWQAASERECRRYGLDRERVLAAMQGDDPLAKQIYQRRWWEWMVAAIAIGSTLWLAGQLGPSAIAVSAFWPWVLGGATLSLLAMGGGLLWKRTGFS